MTSEPVRRRRRGATLESAVLEATWAEVMQHGYSGFTVHGVAARAGTSKAVLYRRWPAKPELVRAAIEHVLTADPISAPDTGVLREDVVGLLRRLNERRVGMAAQLVANLGDFFRETGADLESLRRTASAGHTSAMSAVMDRALGRGDVEPGTVTDRVVRLPIDLLRMELLMSSGPVSDAVIDEIVDIVFLPLVVGSQPPRAMRDAAP
jgi:AcrR family transcriptional regulator